MNTEQNAVPSARWVVVVSVTDPATGAQVAGQPHPCRDLLHARTLLTEIRDLAEEFRAYLPGLSVEGFTVA